MVGVEKLEELEAAGGDHEFLWEALVKAKLVSDEELLSNLSTRFRLKLADLSKSKPDARDIVPEQVAKQYHILPIVITDSYLEIATANPFDLDCEKTLAFATGREVRILLASPAALRERIEEFYVPASAIGALLEGMETDTEIVHEQDEEEFDD